MDTAMFSLMQGQPWAMACADAEQQQQQQQQTHTRQLTGWACKSNQASTDKRVCLCSVGLGVPIEYTFVSC
jgi:hypothetical protein